MRPGYSILILSLIILAVIIAGCSGNNRQSTPTPSPTPNVTATPTAVPDIKGTIHSSQVRMADFKIIQGAGRTGNYTITLQNLGSIEARNVSVNIYAKDIKTLDVTAGYHIRAGQTDSGEREQYHSDSHRHVRL